MAAHTRTTINCDERDFAAVRRMLLADPVWTAYALADLQPHLAEGARWMTARRTDTGEARSTGDAEALVLLYSAMQPTVLLTTGEPALVEAILAQAEVEGILPPAIYASIREEHLAAVTRYYDLAATLRPMRRMVLEDVGAWACEETSQGPRRSLGRRQRDAGGAADPVRLGGADAGAVLRLLAHGGAFAPDAFSPSQIEAGVFYGVFLNGELLAVGGTHVVDEPHAAAAIGNMYTHPLYRRRGLSAAVLQAIVGDLLAGGIWTIVLNVDRRNPGAEALYAAHGFSVYTDYCEGPAPRTGETGETRGETS
jgi:GNAT superfamily N-acetyltransferase